MKKIRCRNKSEDVKNAMCPRVLFELHEVNGDLILEIKCPRCGKHKLFKIGHLKEIELFPEEIDSY